MPSKDCKFYERSMNSEQCLGRLRYPLLPEMGCWTSGHAIHLDSVGHLRCNPYSPNFSATLSLLTRNSGFLLPVFDISANECPFKHSPCSYSYFSCALNLHPKFVFDWQSRTLISLTSSTRAGISWVVGIFQRQSLWWRVLAKSPSSFFHSGCSLAWPVPVTSLPEHYFHRILLLQKVGPTAGVSQVKWIQISYKKKEMRFIRTHKLSIMKQSVGQLSGCKPQVILPALLLPVSHFFKWKLSQWPSCVASCSLCLLAMKTYLSNLPKASLEDKNDPSYSLPLSW